jgi:hypothetical protein
MLAGLPEIGKGTGGHAFFTEFQNVPIKRTALTAFA